MLTIQSTRYYLVFLQELLVIYHVSRLGAGQLDGTTTGPVHLT